MPTIMISFAVICGIYWLFQLLVVIKTIKSMPLLENVAECLPGALPRLSVIIPACNEGETLEAAMNSRLKDPYPAIEYILIDDRSTDNTWEIARAIAAKDNRVKLVRIEYLPDGWLGKVHAMHEGLKYATGEWLLFSDADVKIKPGTMKRVMNYCLQHQVDHLVLIPGIYSSSFIPDIAISVFLKALVVFSRSWKIKDKESSAYGGAGAFNLVRREVFEKTPGFAWLRLEVADDLTLGQVLKGAGASCDAINGQGFVEVDWYPNFRSMLKGLGRAFFAGMGNYNLWQLLPLVLISLAMDIFPFFLIVPMGIPYLPIAGIMITSMAYASHLLVNHFFNRSLRSAIFMPLGNIICFLVALWGGFYYSIRGGITWRDTFYSNKSLRNNRRFKIFFRIKKNRRRPSSLVSKE